MKSSTKIDRARRRIKRLEALLRAAGVFLTPAAREAERRRRYLKDLRAYREASGNLPVTNPSDRAAIDAGLAAPGRPARKLRARIRGRRRR